MNYSKKQIYAVETGDYVGQMFAVVEIDKDHIGCLSLPEMENIKVPKESFDSGRNNDILSLVEELPKDVFKVVESQYFKNENSDNRRQQLNTPNVLYSKEPGEKE
tara:strand:- start:897 stop:1211 length:315 start_codon:yes stop_codon:yes gene_type:complete